MDAWEELEAERVEMADLLGTLTAEQAGTPSLCDRWRVRDVAGHVYWVATTGPTKVATEWFRAGMRTNTMMDRCARAAGSMDVEELAGRLRDVAPSRVIAPGFPPKGYLADVLVHNQDIRRPLGLPRDIPADRLRLVLDHYLGANWFTGGKSRTRGLRMIATDIDWSRGDGPEVRGTGESILMAAVGRADALDDLDGEGLATFRSRLA